MFDFEVYCSEKPLISKSDFFHIIKSKSNHKVNGYEQGIELLVCFFHMYMFYIYLCLCF